jgi:hypothetical protein
MYIETILIILVVVLGYSGNLVAGCGWKGKELLE